MNICLCGHGEDRHGRNAAGPHAGGCHAALCGCMWFRPDPDAGRAARDCRQPCDDDCPFGRAHCWNWHRPEGEPDWHHPGRCDAANKDAATGTEGAA